MKKVLLAYSGGLDTSIMLHWLTSKGYEVYAYIADVGQDEDFERAKQKALKIGAKAVFIEDLKEELIQNYAIPAIKSNAIYENRYMLGTAVARPIIAKRQIDLCTLHDINCVAHGATGKGNDQIRFEFAYYALRPDIEVIALWRDDEFLLKFAGRNDMLCYAEENMIPIERKNNNKVYSEDDNILHISHEGLNLEDPYSQSEEFLYSRTNAIENTPDETLLIEIEFQNAAPISVTCNEESKITTFVSIFNCLNKLGTKHGIGRVDMVENRFIGIKSRGVYESPCIAILHAAYRDLEGIVLDREVLRLRDYLANEMSRIIYNGMWFSPEMEFILHAIKHNDAMINGKVILKLHKGNVYPVARSSNNSLYDADLSSMNKEGGFNQRDSSGFIKINAIRLINYYNKHDKIRKT